MKLYLDNVDLTSRSGPNSFGRKLFEAVNHSGHEVTTSPGPCDFQLSFIQIARQCSKNIALRLDGIYFNNRQDWQRLNGPIKHSHDIAGLVIYQSQFNKNLTEKYFGSARDSIVINNGVSREEIGKISPSMHPIFDQYDEVWCCSSSWRPHKRLRSNIEYFLNMRSNKTGLIILGDNPDHTVRHPDIFYVGSQPWETCISVYKRCKKFLHLAFLDHCPNVVVDARACGCELVVSSSGGTREISGVGAKIIKDIEWDMNPLDLYAPPDLDFEKYEINQISSDIDINSVADRYMQKLNAIMKS